MACHHRADGQGVSILRELGLEKIATQPFNTLSGGRKQLVSMAQSLISNPKVLLLDEPTSALDLRHQLIVMEQAKDYTKRIDAVTIFVVHDLLLAPRYDEQLLVLHNGGMLAFDRADTVLTPQLFETVYGVTARVEKTLEGFMSILPWKHYKDNRRHWRHGTVRTHQTGLGGLG